MACVFLTWSKVSVCHCVIIVTIRSCSGSLLPLCHNIGFMHKTWKLAKLAFYYYIILTIWKWNCQKCSIYFPQNLVFSFKSQYWSCVLLLLFYILKRVIICNWFLILILYFSDFSQWTL
jgi:hypothetical protein